MLITEKEGFKYRYKDGQDTLIMATWDDEEYGNKTVCQLYENKQDAVSDYLINPYRHNIKFYTVISELELGLQKKEQNETSQS